MRSRFDMPPDADDCLAAMEAIEGAAEAMRSLAEDDHEERLAAEVLCDEAEQHLAGAPARLVREARRSFLDRLRRDRGGSPIPGKSVPRERRTPRVDGMREIG